MNPMRHRWSCRGMVLATLMMLPGGVARGEGAPSSAKAPRGEIEESIERGIRMWNPRSPGTWAEGTEWLVSMGEAAVPAMMKLIEDGDPKAHHAAQVLGQLGAKARPVVPRLIEIARAKASPQTQKGQPASKPKGRSPAQSRRVAAMGALGQMTWASAELIPMFQVIAEDDEEPERIRRSAFGALGYMDEKGMPILRRLARGKPSKTRKYAREALSRALYMPGARTRERAEVFAQLIEDDLFGPEVPGLLRHTAKRGTGRPHPVVKQVKTAYRERLRKSPDAELALALATIIQDQLNSTHLEWAAPTDMGSGTWPREDPSESFATLAPVLTLAFEQAEKGSDLRRTFGIALAKLRLLQGDWEGMNRALVGLGQKPIPKDGRPFLAAPPVNWTKDLSAQWTQSDKAMRSGDCGLVFRIEKDGKGLHGVHVLVKKGELPKPDPRRAVSTGWRAGAPGGSLFYAPYPLHGSPLGSFGFRGGPRHMTRYGISDDSGRVTFEKLPEVPIMIEVLVPTANFSEPGRAWELWMEVEPGQLKPAIPYGGGVNCREPPAVVQLKSGQTVEYPRLIVLPKMDLEVDDWAEVDPKTFVLSWPDLAAGHQDGLTYEVVMVLSGPSSYPDSVRDRQAIGRTTEVVRTNRCEVGAKGVGGQRLGPGNIYVFQVVARDKAGKIVSRSLRRRVWTAWGYRPSDPPQTEGIPRDQCPIQVSTYFRQQFRHGFYHKREGLRDKVVRLLNEYPNAFEREYLQVGKAWLDWHQGERDEARRQIKKFSETLPKGSVPQATAAWLGAQMDAGADPPRRLKLVGGPPWTDG